MSFTKKNVSHLEKETLSNKNYRKVIYTVPNQMQLVIMSIPKNKDIHREVHPKTTQFIRIEKGTALATIGSKRKRQYTLTDGDSIIIPPNTFHRVQNVGKNPLKLYTIYTPPEHKPGLVQKRRPKK